MATRQEMLPLSMDTQQNKQSEQEAKTVMYVSVYVCVCVCVCVCVRLTEFYSIQQHPLTDQNYLSQCCCHCYVVDNMYECDCIICPCMFGCRVFNVLNQSATT